MPLFSRLARLSRTLGLVIGTMATLAVVAASAAPMGYNETEVSNGGSVSGRVYFENNFPPPETIQLDRDTETCGLQISSEQLVVDPESGAVAHAVVKIDGITSGKAFASADQRIDQLKCRYQPHVTVVHPGEQFNITNQDPMLHNVHAYRGNETAFNLAQPFQGQSSAQTLDDEGALRIACDVHNWMEAWVLVIDSPYFAITDSSGTFSITDVPPGTYTISMWHEVMGTNQKTITVTSGAESTIEFAIGN